MTTEFWIEKAWGDSVENATFNDIDAAIKETIAMDDEHGAFWVGHDGEYVMEIDKSLRIIFVYGEDQQHSLIANLNNWEEAKSLYKQFFESKFEKLKSRFNK